jgi:hypothetical protein
MTFFANVILKTEYLMFLSVVDAINISVLKVAIISPGEGSVKSQIL